ncbi:phosphatidylinositol N-acetylglucosaminyltransferase subunit C-like [Acanthaster planci]|uniref:Phosphatidylinositol N-acetylglucosaminyltransferase subunit C-like n=1 Tax=Acanthaster planci TaxID=133434 RepID=A0A8B7ZPV1_ACAPL|nr:phosphatidylinositol N-acetylglucosaminyltransferase subunit C-like [Acanthaster planci]XP_022107078.1 phosphatidylinositol N-acetylglucosaminyltransferase subunit C-like [Acanthaster planci]
MYERMSPNKWQKVLYKDQGVPDNYVDESFLRELKNKVTLYDLPYVIVESGVVTQQISSICLFVVLFIYMEQELLLPVNLLYINAALSLLGYAAHDIVDGGQDRKESSRSRLDDLKSTAIFVAFSYGLSPILKTLTDTISTDTIYAMTVFMLLGNLLFHDYASAETRARRSVSLNASIFASVCLASRLPSTLHAFATVTVAMQLFALWPELRRKLKVHFPRTQIPLTLGSSLIALCAVASVSHVGAIILILVHLAVTFLVPICLIRLQQFKNNIHGPWDEAVIQHS